MKIECRCTSIYRYIHVIICKIFIKFLNYKVLEEINFSIDYFSVLDPNSSAFARVFSRKFRNYMYSRYSDLDIPRFSTQVNGSSILIYLSSRVPVNHDNSIYALFIHRQALQRGQTGGLLKSFLQCLAKQSRHNKISEILS